MDVFQVGTRCWAPAQGLCPAGCSGGGGAAIARGPVASALDVAGPGLQDSSNPGLAADATSADT